jgi:membrane associated rhomboid family serine protease
MMTAFTPTPDAVLRLCAAADPAPWYPSLYAQSAGIERDSLDAPLNQLRLTGLVQISGWEAGKGQSYVLTDVGRRALTDPKVLRRAGGLSPTVNVQDQETDARRSTVRRSAWDRGETVRGAFSANSYQAPVLFALMALQVLVFMGGFYVTLRRHAPVRFYLEHGVIPIGADLVSPVQPLVLTVAGLKSGEWWQLLTSALVHFGALHLAMNLYGHYALGPLVERMFGSVRFLVLYVLSALGGGVAAALLSPPAAATAGSSGALCGMIGGFAAFVALNRRHLGRYLFETCKRWFSNTIVLLVLFSLLPGVSWQGHLGGFVAGAVAGVLLTYHRFGTPEQRWAALLGLVLLPVAGLAPLVEKGILRRPKPPVVWDSGETKEQTIAREWPDFKQRVGVAIEGHNRLRSTQNQLYDQVIAALRNQPARARKPELVTRGRVMLGGLHVERDKVRRQIERCGPYKTVEFEQARKAAIEFLDASDAVTKSFDACIARGTEWQNTPAPLDVHKESDQAGTFPVELDGVLPSGSRWQMADKLLPTDESRLQELLNDELAADLRWRHLAFLTTKYDPDLPNNPYKPPNTSAAREPAARVGASNG